MNMMTTDIKTATRRFEEASLIRSANVACAMGRLLLGELRDWHEFLAPDLIDYASLPRRHLKSGKESVRKDVSSRIEKFCAKNFFKMDQKALVRLYETVKGKRGLEMPYLVFCEQFSEVRNFTGQGYPQHSTVSISLWGLQYRYPEGDFTNDLLLAIDQMTSANLQLKLFDGMPHADILSRREDLTAALRNADSSKRQIMQTTFSLLECYLNGLAWNFCQRTDAKTLSKTQEGLLKDTSSTTLRDKMTKYPKIIFGDEVDGGRLSFLLDVSKQYRDSLMHPSPFSAPERFGGYDKLEKIRSLNDAVVKSTVLGMTGFIRGVIDLERQHSSSAPLPVWLSRLEKKFDEAWGVPNAEVSAPNSPITADSDSKE